ncbi:MAG: chitobiase/beta-hexosaminidase C-terminal domain-containing protein, partial [Bacteroidales bacterium]|nr:chitobiase/beta-hexosaminidase C-terminal domain-containing protein [Bacteroidales bacterium]
KFNIIANNISHENRYIESVKLNGKPLNRSYLYYDEVAKGGKLVFEMTNKRNSQWGMAEECRPTMRIEKDDIVTTPIINVVAYVFYDKLNVSITHPEKGVKIYYTLDGTEPTVGSTPYVGPFVLEATTDVKAIAVKDDVVSTVAVGAFKKIDGGRHITIKNPYSSQYEAGGDIALIDLQRGNDNFRVGMWQGYSGVDIIATVDMEKPMEIHRLAGSFLQDQGSWIFMPTQVEFFVSNDGKNFRSIGVVKNEVPVDAEDAVIQELEVVKDVKARYVRMVAKSLGICPEWHVGAGGAAWTFCDEFIIE